MKPETLAWIYYLKPLVPRRVQIALRSYVALRKLGNCRDVWPIDSESGKMPENWEGWPGRKRFAVVLTHDVETRPGHERCMELAKLEMDLGFRSSFNFVPERYVVSPTLRKYLVDNGFEVGVHGLNHDGKYYKSHSIFRGRAIRINRYLKEWGAVGFRSPSMIRNLGWLQDLEIAYDLSTFDTDPFEPQPDGMKTIFPFRVNGRGGHPGFIELPCTLPQDFTLFVLLRQEDTAIWDRKLCWIAEHGGMSLMNVHPDYMSFGEACPKNDEYSATLYADFLKRLKARFDGSFWHALPREVAAWVAERDVTTTIDAQGNDR